MSKKSNPESVSFEIAMKQLEDVVKQLETGALSLEESVALYEQGMKLSLYCQQKLNQVEQKVEIVVQSSENWQTQPFIHESNIGDD